MSQIIKNRDIYTAALFFLLTITIGYQEMVSPAIGITVILIITDAIVHKSLRFEFNVYTFLFVVLFLFYMLGIVWAEHRDIGWKLLEYKMSFFIFPVLFFFRKKKLSINFVLYALPIGCIILIIRFIIAWVGNVEETFSFAKACMNNLHLHPSYAAAYFTLASIFLILDFIDKKNTTRLFVWLPFILITVFLNISLESFAALLFMALTVIFSLAYFIYKKLSWKWVLVYFFLGVLIAIIGYTQIDLIKKDTNDIEQVILDLKKGKTFFLEKNKTSESGTYYRMMLWLISIEIIAENPWGVGTGDIDFYIDNKCEKYAITHLRAEKLNPHNQFFQIGIDIGIIGMLYLLFMVIIFFRFALKNKNYFLLFVITNLFFNALFESVFQRQSGIVFFTLVICLLLVYQKKSTTEIKVESDDFSK